MNTLLRLMVIVTLAGVFSTEGAGPVAAAHAGRIAEYQTGRVPSNPEAPAGMTTSEVADTALSHSTSFTVTRQIVSQSSDYPAWIPHLSPRARQLLRLSLSAGHNPRLFTVAGDSNSNPIRYLGNVASGEFDLSHYAYLQPVVSYYSPSFTHTSIAVGGGFRAADMFSTVNMGGFDGCMAGEGMFACELRLSNASIVFIQLGTGDKFVWRDFEQNYRAMLDYAIARNVLTVLVTKADDIESLQGGASFGYINAVIRSLASEYQLPLLDMYAASRNLPVIPNPNLPHRPYTIYGLQDEWGYYFHLNQIGQNLHILITLQTLDLLNRLR